MNNVSNKSLGTFIIAVLIVLISPASFGAVISKEATTSCSNVDYALGWNARENAKRGDPAWSALVKKPLHGKISGWFGQTSASCGDDVDLHLSGNNRAVKITMYRMGYYKGDLARPIFTQLIPKIAPTLIPTILSNQTHLTSTHWPTTTTIHIDENYPTGVYMARFDDGGYAGYAPLIIRNDKITSDFVMVAATLTWQAYNTMGGWSLYHGPNPKIASPGTVVSFNRPYDRDGKSDYTINDAGIVQTLESMGLDTSYTDDIYLNNHPSTLLGHRTVIYDGHPEYWTSAMRDGAIAARDSGVNLLFLGANSAYWRVQLDGSSREITCWKGSPNDPNIANPLLITNKWGQYPTEFNESELMGASMAGIGVNGDYTVTNGDVWPILGSGLVTGDVIHGIVGKEVETTDIGIAPALQTFLSSSVSIAGTAFNVNLSYYTAASYAGVIDVGTSGWVCSITSTCSWKNSADANTKIQVLAITKQILLGSQLGPLGEYFAESANIPKRTKLAPICIGKCRTDLPNQLATN